MSNNSLVLYDRNAGQAGVMAFDATGAVNLNVTDGGLASRRMMKELMLTAVLGVCLPAFGGITYTCDATISSSVCSTLNTTIAGLYSSTFTNANASLYITLGSTGLAASTQFVTNVPYPDYYNALVANEADTNDETAVNSLGGGLTNPDVSGYGVALTSALASALGLTATAESAGITNVDSECMLGSFSGCYNGIITMSNTAGIFYYRTGSQGGGHLRFLHCGGA